MLGHSQYNVQLKPAWLGAALNFFAEFGILDTCATHSFLLLDLYLRAADHRSLGQKQSGDNPI